MMRNISEKGCVERNLMEKVYNEKLLSESACRV